MAPPKVVVTGTFSIDVDIPINKQASFKSGYHDLGAAVRGLRRGGAQHADHHNIGL